MSNASCKDDNTDVLDPESAVEMVLLLAQDRMQIRRLEGFSSLDLHGLSHRTAALIADKQAVSGN